MVGGPLDVLFEPQLLLNRHGAMPSRQYQWSGRLPSSMYFAIDELAAYPHEYRFADNGRAFPEIVALPSIPLPRLDDSGRDLADLA
jgi:hypothetical protein